MFIVLYKELQFRHIYAKHKVVALSPCVGRPMNEYVLLWSVCYYTYTQPTIQQRLESYHNYVELFNLIIGNTVFSSLLGSLLSSWVNPEDEAAVYCPWCIVCSTSIAFRFRWAYWLGAAQPVVMGYCWRVYISGTCMSVYGRMLASIPHSNSFIPHDCRGHIVPVICPISWQAEEPLDWWDPTVEREPQCVEHPQHAQCTLQPCG